MWVMKSCELKYYDACFIFSLLVNLKTLTLNNNSTTLHEE